MISFVLSTGRSSSSARRNGRSRPQRPTSIRSTRPPAARMTSTAEPETANAASTIAAPAGAAVAARSTSAAVATVWIDGSGRTASIALRSRPGRAASTMASTTKFDGRS